MKSFDCKNMDEKDPLEHSQQKQEKVQYNESKTNKEERAKKKRIIKLFKLRVYMRHCCKKSNERTPNRSVACP